MNFFDTSRFRRALTRLPLIGPAAKGMYRAIFPVPPEINFDSSTQYWNDRYALGGNSGPGSYGRLAQFKADTLNAFVSEHAIRSVIEFGSGDGAQLELARYPHYVGIDASIQAIEMCHAKFASDSTKQFFHLSSPEASSTKAELSISLDVIYHLVEDDIYDAYMHRVTACATRFIGIYSSNVAQITPVAHIRHRRFTDWMTTNAASWKLLVQIPNPHPEDPERPDDTSWADFYFYAK